MQMRVNDFVIKASECKQKKKYMLTKRDYRSGGGFTSAFRIHSADVKWFQKVPQLLDLPGLTDS